MKAWHGSWSCTLTSNIHPSTSLNSCQCFISFVICSYLDLSMSICPRRDYVHSPHQKPALKRDNTPNLHQYSCYLCWVSALYLTLKPRTPPTSNLECLSSQMWRICVTDGYTYLTYLFYYRLLIRCVSPAEASTKASSGVIHTHNGLTQRNAV